MPESAVLTRMAMPARTISGASGSPTPK